MNIIKQLIELVYYYRVDQAHGKPYWRDPAVIGLVLSLVCTELAKYAGVQIDTDLQLKIVGVVTGIGALVSPHTGVVPHPCDSKSVVSQNHDDLRNQAVQMAKQVQAKNQIDPTQNIDHGAA